MAHWVAKPHSGVHENLMSPLEYGVTNSANLLY